MSTQTPKQIARRLTAAEGYLELGMPKQALSELQSVTEPGQFKVPYLWILGESLKADGQFAQAIEPLRHVIPSLPSVMAPRALHSLNQCLEQCGQPAEALPVAEAATPAPEAVSTAAATDSPAPVGQLIWQKRLPIQVKIPQLGTLSVSIEDGQVLTIRLQPNE